MCTFLRAELHYKIPKYTADSSSFATDCTAYSNVPADCVEDFFIVGVMSACLYESHKATRFFFYVSRHPRAYDSELFGIKKRFSIVIAHAVRRLLDIQCTYIYGTVPVT